MGSARTRLVPRHASRLSFLPFGSIRAGLSGLRFGPNCHPLTQPTQHSLFALFAAPPPFPNPHAQIESLRRRLATARDVEAGLTAQVQSLERELEAKQADLAMAVQQLSENHASEAGLAAEVARLE